MTENKLNFTSEEDYFLMKLIKIFGMKKIKLVVYNMNKIFNNNTRTINQIKERYDNYIDPYDCTWNILEEFIFYNLQCQFGNKWAKISTYLPGRTDNNIKNHFYSSLRKNLKRVSKKKLNFSSITDKVKCYYTLIYFIENYNTNVDKISNIINDVNVKEVFNNISNQNLCDYVNLLCDSIIKDEFSKDLLSFSNSVDINNVDHKNIISNLINEIVKKYINLSFKNKSQKIITTPDKHNNSNNLFEVEEDVSYIVNKFMDYDSKYYNHDSLNNLFVEDVVDKFCKYDQESKNKQFKETYLISNIESSLINSVFSSIIKCNYTDNYYNNKIEIKQDELNCLFDKFETSVYGKIDNFENINFLSKKRSYK